jgi:hypothetical protein
MKKKAAASRVHNPWRDSFLADRNHEDEWKWGFRHARTHKYSWSVPTQPALDMIKAFSPEGVIEIGAGTGYWASLLRAMAVDVIAVDANPVEKGKNRHHLNARSWTNVQRGFATSAALYPERTLMLCWPPHNQSMSHRALKHYAGDRLVYIGQSRGGMTGTEAFHRALEQHWQLIAKKRLLNFREISDGLCLYLRR